MNFKHLSELKPHSMILKVGNNPRSHVGAVDVNQLIFENYSDARVMSAIENLVRNLIILSSEQLLDKAQGHTLFRVRKTKY